MSDQNKPPPTLPTLPEQFQFPVQLLEDWSAIPGNERVQAALTRQEVDHFFIGLLRSADAQRALADTVVSWSNGEQEKANRLLAEFQRLNLDAQNQYRQFMTAFMFSALRTRHGK